MVETFTDIMFTPSVKAAQEQLGSRAMYEKVEKEGHSSNELTDREKEFIEARDSFYQATVGETGWP
ncbi:MAG: pyridoxamine 5'-phosphate oxidase, partial [Rhodospirillaceae bacterium]|nr:pyridoxamine 5'-phosphate oxidase [Rhodospirillaceae bacterium]